MPRKDVHVVPHSDGWAVKRPGADRASSVHDTQAGAIDAGRDLAKAAQSELFIHGRNGQIRDRDSFGPDPCPPRDKRH